MKAISSVAIFIWILWTIVLESVFLSIKVPSESSFIFISKFDLVSHFLKDSLKDMVMTNDNVEIILSRSRQVKLKSKLVETNKSYPQWKLTRILSRDIYEGIHISKRNNLFTIHSLLIEVDNPIPFSNDESWSAHIYMLESEPTLFFGPSVSTLKEIIEILFGGLNKEIQFFRNSFLIMDSKETVLYHQVKRDNPINLNLIESPSDAYYIGLKESLQVIYRTSNGGDNVHKMKFERTFFVNYEAQYTLEDIIKVLQADLETKKLVHISNDHDFVMNCHQNKTKFVVLNSRITLSSYGISPEIFLDALQNVFEKILFKSTIPASLIIAYDKGDQLLLIFIKDGVFAPSMKNMIMESLMEKYSIKLAIHGLHYFTFDTLKMEDRSGHVLQLSIEDLNQINLESILPSLKRIFLFTGRFSPNLKVVKKESLSLSSLNENLQFDKFNKGLVQQWNAIKNATFEKRDMKKTDDSKDGSINGLEIIFDHENNKISSSLLVLKSVGESVKDLDPCHQWIFLLIDTESKKVIGSRVSNSYDYLLILQKIIHENVVILVKKIQGTIINSTDGVIEMDLRRASEKLWIDMIKLLLVQMPLYEISIFRLLGKYKIEVDIVKPEMIDQFMDFINKQLGKKIEYKSVKRGSRIGDEVLLGKRVWYKTNEHLDRVNVHGRLNWNKAIKFLLKEPSLSSLSSSSNPSKTVQVMEREGERSFSGNITVIRYDKKLTLKYIQAIKNKKDIMRIGKCENYGNEKISFLFIQYSTNRAHGRLNQDDDYGKNDYFTFDSGFLDDIALVIREVMSRSEKCFNNLEFERLKRKANNQIKNKRMDGWNQMHF